MIEQWGKRAFKLPKDGHSKDMISTADNVNGVIKVSSLDTEFINSFFGSIEFTEDYDNLPLPVRMWLSVWRWKEFVTFAKSFGLEVGDKFLYTDFVEIESDKMLAGPIIITNDDIAVIHAPKVVEFEEFEILHHCEELPLSVDEKSGKEKQ